MSLWVTDSSPLIFLAKLNRLDLLRQEAKEVLAPPAVLEEIAEQNDEAKRQIEVIQTAGTFSPRKKPSTLTIVLTHMCFLGVKQLTGL